AADWLIIAAALAAGAWLRRTWNVAVWGNDQVAAGSGKVLAGMGTVAKAAAAAIPSRKAQPLADGRGSDGPDVIPITHPAPLPRVEPRSETIPIHSHMDAALASAQLRAVPEPDDDDGEPLAYDLPSLALLNDPD